jgi:hypothetical protein
MIKQTLMKSYRQESFWKCCVLVPQTHGKAVEIDLKNNNTAWQEARSEINESVVRVQHIN